MKELNPDMVVHIVADILSAYLNIDNLTALSRTSKDISKILYDNNVARDRILQKIYSELVLREFKINSEYHTCKYRMNYFKQSIKSDVEKQTNKICSYKHKKGKQKGKICGKHFESVDGRSICPRHSSNQCSSELIANSIKESWRSHKYYFQYKQHEGELKILDEECAYIDFRIEKISLERSKLRS